MASKFDHFRLEDAPVVPRTGTYRLSGTIRLQPGQSANLTLFGEARPQLSFERTANGEVSLRLWRGPVADMQDFAHGYSVPLGDLDEFYIDVFVDNGLVQFAADDGRIWATNLHFPGEVAELVSLNRHAVAIDREVERARGRGPSGRFPALRGLTIRAGV